MRGTHRSGRGRSRQLPTAWLVVGVALAVVACDSSTTGVQGDGTDGSTTSAETTAELTAALGEMTDPLDLSDAQRQALTEIARRYRERLGEPGILWYAAADLHAVLTSEQIARIVARREELDQRVRDRLAQAVADGSREAFVGLGGSGFGPRGGPRGQVGAGAGPADGLAGLDLTEEQREAIRAVLEAYRPELEALRQSFEDGQIAWDEFRDQVSAVREAIHEEVMALLTPEQLAALETFREERRQWAEQEKVAMVEVLGLSEEQIARLEELRQSWADEDPSGFDSPAARRDAHRAAVEAILTDVQQEITVLHDSVAGHLLMAGGPHAGFGPHRGGGPGGLGPGGFGPGGDSAG